ncbi:MAG: hypothetical protein RIQ81_2742 [Pseudomonadota bacterium]
MKAGSKTSLQQVALILFATTACGRPTVESDQSLTTPAQDTAFDTSNGELALDGGGADSSYWPVGRQAPYKIDVKCDNWSTAINGANSQPQSIEIPSNAKNCFATVTRIDLANRKYYPTQPATLANSAQGSHFELKNSANPQDILGVVVQKQIPVNGNEPGQLDFKFTAITERKALGASGVVKSIFLSANGTSTAGKVFYEEQSKNSSLCDFFLKNGLGRFMYQHLFKVRFSSEIATLSTLKEDAVRKILNSKSSIPTLDSCGEPNKWTFSGEFPPSERMIVAWNNEWLLMVKTTSIVVPYSYK